MATVKTYAASRLLDMGGGRIREPGYHLLGSGEHDRGQLVPEAHTVLRLDSMLHTGFVEEVEVDEDEFRAAIAEYCPELEDEILAKVGLDREGSVFGGTESAPYHPEEPPASTEELANTIPPAPGVEEEAPAVEAQAIADNVCPVCGEEFKSAAGMKSHRTRMHSEG